MQINKLTLNRDNFDRLSLVLIIRMSEIEDVVLYTNLTTQDPLELADRFCSIAKLIREIANA